MSSQSESTSSATYDPQLLRNFQCPYELDPTSLCTYYEISPNVCPFGHRSDVYFSTVGENVLQLKEIPLYICVRNLGGLCGNPTVGHGTSSSTSTSLTDDGGLVRCLDGFHPTIDELVDLEHLHQKLASVILTKDQVEASQNNTSRILVGQEPTSTSNAEEQIPGPSTATTESENSPQNSSSFIDGPPTLSKTIDPSTSSNPQVPKPTTIPHDHQCSICMDSILSSNRHFGLLENCSHIFCSHCILVWHNRSVDKTCPECRTKSQRILISSHLVHFPQEGCDEKRTLFDLQYRCLALSKGETVRVDDLLSSENMDNLNL